MSGPKDTPAEIVTTNPTQLSISGFRVELTVLNRLTNSLRLLCLYVYKEILITQR